MFPDIPEAAIRADLARTGSPTITSDNILRNGGMLPLPPSTRAEQRAEALGTSTTAPTSAGMVEATASGVALNATQSPLVNRMRMAESTDAEPLPQQPPKVWEADSTRRADILRRRKEFMLMEARKRYLDEQGSGGSTSAGAPARAPAPAQDTAGGGD